MKERHFKIMELVSQGLTNPQIAKRIGITRFMVTNYISHTLDCIGMSNRVELTLWYLKRLEETT